MPKVSSVSGTRVGEMVVQRAVHNTSIKKTDKVTASASSKNSTLEASDNYLLSSEYFYENMKKGVYRRKKEEVVAQEEELKKQMKESLESSNQEVLNVIKNLVEKYNHTMAALMKSDLTNKDIYIRNIVKTVTLYNKTLNDLGIILQRDHLLNIDENKFVRNISKSKNYIDLLFDYEKGIIKKIYESFKLIKEWNYYGK